MIFTFFICVIFCILLFIYIKIDEDIPTIVNRILYLSREEYVNLIKSIINSAFIIISAILLIILLLFYVSQFYL